MTRFSSRFSYLDRPPCAFLSLRFRHDRLRVVPRFHENRPVYGGAIHHRRPHRHLYTLVPHPSLSAYGLRIPFDNAADARVTPRMFTEINRIRRSSSSLSLQQYDPRVCYTREICFFHRSIVFFSLSTLSATVLPPFIIHNDSQRLRLRCRVSFLM